MSTLSVRQCGTEKGVMVRETENSRGQYKTVKILRKSSNSDKQQLKARIRVKAMTWLTVELLCSGADHISPELLHM